MSEENREPPSDSTGNTLEVAASVTQSFNPLKGVCAHLNALHVYAEDTSRCVEANHYCSHISQDVRQCLIYDSDSRNARLIGIEYMVTPQVFETLPEEERKLWHSHVYEVKSGMLVMPTPQIMPTGAWDMAETKEMEQVITLYGKVYHLWQVDLGHLVPLGSPKLMTSFTSDEQVRQAGGDVIIQQRDQKYGVSSKQKAEKRAYISEPSIHPDSDQTWRREQS